MDAPLSFMVLTEVEWRRPDGTVLSRAIQAPSMVTGGILTDGNTPLPLMEPYDVFARPADRSADWRRVYEVDPVNRTVARLDL
jgi:hypothetical protein